MVRIRKNLLWQLSHFPSVSCMQDSISFSNYLILSVPILHGFGRNVNRSRNPVSSVVRTLIHGVTPREKQECWPSSNHPIGRNARKTGSWTNPPLPKGMREDRTLQASPKWGSGNRWPDPARRRMRQDSRPGPEGPDFSMPGPGTVRKKKRKAVLWCLRALCGCGAREREVDGIVKVFFSLPGTRRSVEGAGTSALDGETGDRACGEAADFPAREPFRKKTAGREKKRREASDAIFGTLHAGRPEKPSAAQGADGLTGTGESESGTAHLSPFPSSGVPRHAFIPAASFRNRQAPPSARGPAGQEDIPDHAVPGQPPDAERVRLLTASVEWSVIHTKATPHLRPCAYGGGHGHRGPGDN